MSKNAYNYIVVGKGMIGSAAARHLSTAHQGVALIGPDEPRDRTTHKGVFSSHYDEGRITRILDDDIVWATLAKRAIERYHPLEIQSGVQFYDNVGYLFIADPNLELFSKLDRVGVALDAQHERLGPDDLAERFPYLSQNQDYAGLFQSRMAGHISPRNIVKAQVAAARGQGTRVVNSVVHKISTNGANTVVTTTEGDTYQGQKVLIATGGFSNASGLLPSNIDFVVVGRTILLARLGAEKLDDLSGMPSAVYAERNGHITYVLPPIQYPDGNFYVKVGIDSDTDSHMSTLEDLRKWFQNGGSDENMQVLSSFIESFIPVLEGAETHADTCVTTHTRSGYPYICIIEGTSIGYAVGGNGFSAKSSDEIGRVAALMISNDEWVYDIPAEWFKPHFVE